ncbi:cytochrome c1 [Pusillimonas sp. CC-YST705]|uniref:Cytochrome c1 n=1 Tax=Mesopusillimonas faecipullorum TaxID=2755040 RepID=A0ABS8CDG2_9BURK|nr:cytochrome c1 [Mesopusillimonas faecipullorum]MCB5363639.1 cytochrome c1 [Mesopusillimonas faecipullorum]
MIKKLLGILAISLSCSVAFAAESGYQLEKAPNRINDLAALQNGAKLFVNYCMGCHSANALRYNKLTELGLTEDEIRKNLMFASDKIGDLMTIAMSRGEGTKWFGAPPPDLSVIARAKSVNLGPTGVDYIYNFMRTFYRDNSKLTGWDNAVFANPAMPHALWTEQGPITYVRTSFAPKATDDGKTEWVRTVTTFDPQGFKEVETEVVANHRGGETVQHSFQYADRSARTTFDNNVADLANFLGWMAEPNQLFRKRLGVWVILFLGLFLVVAWRLNAAYWKHVK